MVVRDRDLRNEQALSKAGVTDSQGNYLIEYSAENYVKADSIKAAPDLIVRVFNHDRGLLVESPIRFNANRNEIVDFVIAAPALSEWERINKSVLLLLEGQSEDGQLLSPADLNTKDIDFISEDAGLDKEQLRLWSLSFNIAKSYGSTGIASPRTSMPIDYRLGSHAGSNVNELAVLENIAPLYGWFRDGKPQDIAALLLIAVTAFLSPARVVSVMVCIAVLCISSKSARCL